MYFDYEAYRVYGYESSVTSLVVFSIGIFYFSAWLVYVIMSKQWDWKKYAFHVLWLVGSWVVVFIQIGVLCNGGIYLRDEKETDAVEMQGEISDIKGLGSFSFPVVKGNYRHEEKNGYEFIINGVQCKAVLKGSLEVGDYVTVKYLPKRGYILYIGKTEEESDIE
ncbi:MAG: hypothetical protein K2N81_11435 [Acetatifactor sp.]|nr:hypothetical protein [Acetatifactor sp.]